MSARASVKSKGSMLTVEAARHGEIQYLSNNPVSSSFHAWAFKSLIRVQSEYHPCNQVENKSPGKDWGWVRLIKEKS